MAWNPVITNIVTTPSLTTALSSYTTLTKHNTDLALKLDKTNGLATDLKLTGSMSTPDSAITKSYVDSSVSTVSTNISNKADKASPTFTGTVTVPNGTSATSAVNLSQLQLYLPLTGGTVTGQIKSALTPSAGSDLTNKAYVDNLVATKASGTYVDDAVAALDDEVTTTYMPKTGGIFTSTVSGPTPLVTSNGNELATTSWVVTAIEDAVGPGLMSLASEDSVDAKLSLMAPQVGAQLMSAEVVGEEDPDDHTKAVASHKFVHDVIDKVLGDLIRSTVEQVIIDQRASGDK